MKKIVLMCIVSAVASSCVLSAYRLSPLGGGGSHGPVVSTADMTEDDCVLAVNEEEAKAEFHQAHANKHKKNSRIFRTLAQKKRNQEGNNPSKNPVTGGFAL